MLRRLAVLAPLLAALLLTPSALAQNRIVGGHQAAAGTWPAIVALMDLSRPLQPGDPHDWDQQICGGTLVAPQWVLTAAHCVTDEDDDSVEPPAQFQIMYGSHRLDDTGTRVPVAEVHRNPDYVPATTTNDVALLKLATPVPNASTLPLASPALSGLWGEGRTAQVAGWGNLEETDPDAANPPYAYPIDLMEITTLPLVSDADCGDAYGGGFTAPVMVCAGDLDNGGVDTCDGDSGGPLTVADAAGHQVLVGDTSFGAGCAWPGIPGVYGEIAGMRTFVDATLGWSTAATVDRTSLTYAPSTTQTVTLTSAGSAPLSVAAAQLSGSGAGDFSVTRDGCSLVVLTAGQTCSVDVAAGTAGGSATLALVGDGAAGTQTVALSAAAAPPPPPPPVVTPPAPAPVVVTPKVAPPAPRPPALSAFSALTGHRLSVRLAGPGTVTVTVVQKVRQHGRTVSRTLATGSATFAKAGTKTITLKLTRAGRKALRHHGHPRTTATVVVKSGAAKSTSTRSLTLR